MAVRSVALMVLSALLARCGGGASQPPVTVGPVGDPVPTVIDLDLAGTIDGGSLLVPLRGRARTLERDVRAGSPPAAQLRWPASGHSSPQASLTLRGLTLDRGAQTLSGEVTLPGDSRLFRGTVALSEVAVRFTHEGTSPWVLEAKIAGSRLSSNVGGQALTLSGTLTAAPDCRLATGRAVPFFCGTVPFLGLVPQRTALPSRPRVASCPTEVAATFVDGTAATFDGQTLRVGAGAPLACRTTPAGTAERPAYLCEGRQTGVQVGDCAWQVEAYGMPSAAGENFTLYVLGQAESGTCAPCSNRWFEE